jgi:geranylgeranyl diphosphate synthase type II
LTDFNLCYSQYLTEFEEYITQYAAKLQTKPSVLAESMKYSLLNGGKRIRPVLALAIADVLKVDHSEVLPFAVAIEMIHTYSLIHDDLPAMDNDDFRRGKPSNHKQFGEANAVLAGDALLNEAYAICFEQSMKGEKYALAGQFLNECAGIYGMLAGQSADLWYSEEGAEISSEELLYIHEHNTGKMLLAPIAITSILSGNKYYLPLENFGKMLGQLFQITDDILDVTGDKEVLGKTTGKDEKENKLTYVKLYGLEGARVRADMCASDCLAILEGVDEDVDFLKGLVDYVLKRSN